MKNNTKIIITISLSIFLIIGITQLFKPNQQSLITITEQNNLTVPQHCKRLGIIGSTPHPTFFLQKNGSLHDLKTLKLEQLVNVDALQESFTQLLALSKEHNIDHILIAYLPVYYARIQKIYSNKTPLAIQHFLRNITPQIKELISQTAKSLDIHIPITMIIPSYAKLKNIPNQVENTHHYCQYLIKQFPHMDWNNSDLETIYIINTRTDDKSQTDCIEQYLNYEYLFERPIHYKQIFIAKKRFHTYRR